MGGKKKGLSLEEKRQKLLEVYYDKVHVSFQMISVERGTQSEGA
jgi:hypothetical protein